MSKISDFLDRNPGVMKTLATAFAVGTIAAAGAVAEAKSQEAKQGIHDAARAAGKEVRTVLAAAARDFEEMGTLLASGTPSGSIREMLIEKTVEVQERLLEAVEKVDALGDEIAAEAGALRPAAVAWRASGVLVDVQVAVEREEFFAAREAIEDLREVAYSAAGTEPRVLGHKN